LELNLASSRSGRTRQAYASCLRQFSREHSIPASPSDVAGYLSALGVGLNSSSVKVHAAAIHAAHVDAGLPSPCSDPLVKRALGGLARRKAGVGEKQASPICADAYDRIVESAQKPRIGRGGLMESVESAMERGLVDMALIGLMRDAMLRRGECAALVWGDLAFESDGSGRLLVRKSKTDQFGAGAVRYVSEGVVWALGAVRAMRFGKPLDSMFGLSDRQLCRRVKSACLAAGLSGSYSGHSPRIGMAMDLARGGASMVELMVAGGWKSPAMPARYCRGIEAGKGAVAEFYSRKAGKVS